MISSNTNGSFYKQCGIGLPEVMITLLLLSSGSLVLTQLQLRNMHAAYESHQASRHALRQGEVIESLWQQRCYLAGLSDAERHSFLKKRYPTLFGDDEQTVMSPSQAWQHHRPMHVDC